MLTKDEILERVIYHAPTEAALAAHKVVRDEIAMVMTRLSKALPESREAALAITKLEEAMMWANAAIARNHDKL